MLNKDRVGFSEADKRYYETAFGGNADLDKIAECIQAGKHSSFERCDHCIKYSEIIGPIETGGLVTGELYRSKAEPTRYYKIVKA